MYTEEVLPAFSAASIAPPPSMRTWAFPWIRSSTTAAFLASSADGLLEQPLHTASVNTRKQNMRALRFIRDFLAFRTVRSEFEGITSNARRQRTGPGGHPFRAPV